MAIFSSSIEANDMGIIEHSMQCKKQVRNLYRRKMTSGNIPVDAHLFLNCFCCISMLFQVNDFHSYSFTSGGIYQKLHSIVM